jgi:hypothetical protein
MVRLCERSRIDAFTRVPDLLRKNRALRKTDIRFFARCGDDLRVALNPIFFSLVLYIFYHLIYILGAGLGEPIVVFTFRILASPR